MAADRGEGRTELLDLRGLNCPLPVLKTARRLSGLRPCQRLWVETSDPLAAIDIPAFCAERGHGLIEIKTTPFGHRFLLERGPDEKNEK